MPAYGRFTWFNRNTNSPKLCVNTVSSMTLLLHVMCCFNGVLLLENESHQTALAIVEEEDQFADCFELVSTILLCYLRVG